MCVANHCTNQPIPSNGVVHVEPFFFYFFLTCFLFFFFLFPFCCVRFSSVVIDLFTTTTLHYLLFYISFLVLPLSCRDRPDPPVYSDTDEIPRLQNQYHVLVGNVPLFISFVSGVLSLMIPCTLVICRMVVVSL